MPKLLAYDIGSVGSVCVLPNSSIISASGDKTLRVWSNPYAASRVFRKEEEWRGLTVLPDGGIAVGNGKYVWVYSDPDPMRGGRARAAAVLSASSEESRARQRAAEERRYQEQRRQANEKAYRDARARENADRAAAARAAAAAIAPIRVLEGHTANVTSVCVLSDGRIVSGSEDNTLRVWTQGATCTEDSCIARWTSRAQTARNRFLGASLKILRGHTDAVTSVCALVGDSVASGSVDMTVRLWSPDTGACLKVFTGHTGPVRCVCEWLGSIVSGSDDQTVRVWDQLLDENINTTPRIFRGHTGSVTCVAALPDDMFISGSDDGILAVWDFYNATCLRVMDAGRERFLSLSVLADGRIISGSDHGMKIWESDEGEPCANVFAARAEPIRRAEAARAEAARAEAARRHVANVVARVAAARASVAPARDAAPKLSISQAPYIGTRVEGQGVFASGGVNAVNQEEFNDGDELVRIPAPGGVKMPPDPGSYHLFHVIDRGGGTLQQWFDQGKRTNPLSNGVIQQNQLERFTYSKPTPAGGKRHNKKRSTRKVTNKSNRRRTARR